MKFMMIFEGVDRATRIMKKIMSVEQKAAASVKAGAQASEHASGRATRASQQLAAAYAKVASGARSALAAVVSGAQAAGRATMALHRQTLILAKSGLTQMGDGAGKMFRGMALAAGVATAAFGVSALAAGQLVGAASQFEKFQTILETTEGSSAKAKEAMGWVTDFAVKTPYELDQVMASFVQLRTRGLDPTNGLLKALGDTSAAMGTPLMQGVEAMADAVTGENERLKEFGITASKTGDKISYEYTNAAGKMMKASVDASDRIGIQTKLMAIFNEKYGGAMEKLSGTWEGMVSNLADLWLKFQLAIMNAGLFDWMKGKLAEILETVNRLQQTGELEKWAARIGATIQTVLESAWAFAVRTYEILTTLGGYLSTAATYVGGWENLAMVLAGIAFAPALVSTAAGIVQIATGLAMLTTALIANPIVLVIAAIVAGAAAIYLNWSPIKAFFLDLWTSVSTAASNAWNAVTSAVSSAVAQIPAIVSAAWDTIKTVFAWHPAIMIIENWGAISGAIGTAMGSVFAAVSAPWDSIKALFEWSPIEAIKAAWAGLSDAVGGFIDDAAGRAGAAWDKVKSVFSFGEDANASASISVTDPGKVLAAAEATAKLNADMQAVAAIDTGPAMAKLSELDAAAQRIAPAVMGAVAQAQAFLASVSFYDQGAALMETMAAGMRARASVVVNEIQQMTQQVRDHLPSSPAKVGPLSDIHRLKFGETIASSIRSEPMVRAMRAASAATMVAASITAPDVAAAATSSEAARAQIAGTAAQSGLASAASGSGGPGGQQINFNPTVNVPASASGSPADIKAAVQQALRESARELAEILSEESRRQGRKEF